MVEGKKYYKEFNERIKATSVVLREMYQNEDDNYTEATLMMLIRLTLYNSRRLFQMSQNAIKANNGKRMILFMLIPRIDTTPYEITVISHKMLTPILTLHGYYDSDLQSELTSFDVHNQAALVICLSSPFNNKKTYTLHVLFGSCVCDYLPPLPVKYLPTIAGHLLSIDPVLFGFASGQQQVTFLCSFHLCAKNRARQRCSRCKLVRYCNSECQQKDWKEHRKICTLCTFEKDDEFAPIDKKILYILSNMFT